MKIQVAGYFDNSLVPNKTTEASYLRDYTQNILWIHQLTPFISISNYFQTLYYFLSAWGSAISGKYQIPELLSSRNLITLSTNPLHSHSILLDTTYPAQVTNFSYFTNTDHLVFIEKAETYLRFFILIGSSSFASSAASCSSLTVTDFNKTLDSTLMKIFKLMCETSCTKQGQRVQQLCSDKGRCGSQSLSE